MSWFLIGATGRFSTTIHSEVARQLSITGDDVDIRGELLLSDNATELNATVQVFPMIDTHSDHLDSQAAVNQIILALPNGGHISLCSNMIDLRV